MSRRTHEPPVLARPRIEHNTDHLPSAVTFFMTRAQRRALLDRLGRISDDRTRALLIGVGLLEAFNAQNEGVRS